MIGIFGHVIGIQFHKRDGVKGNEKEKSANERKGKSSSGRKPAKADKRPRRKPAVAKVVVGQGFLVLHGLISNFK